MKLVRSELRVWGSSNEAVLWLDRWNTELRIEQLIRSAKRTIGPENCWTPWWFAWVCVSSSRHVNFRMKASSVRPNKASWLDTVKKTSTTIPYHSIRWFSAYAQLQQWDKQSVARRCQLIAVCLQPNILLQINMDVSVRSDCLWFQSWGRSLTQLWLMPLWKRLRNLFLLLQCVQLSAEFIVPAYAAKGATCAGIKLLSAHGGWRQN